MHRVAGFLVVLSLAFAGAAASAQQVRIGAAASLTNVIDALGKAWSAESGGGIVGNYAASSALARQIEQGAPIDVFLSADLAWMDYLETKNLIEPGTRRVVAANTLVLIAPAASTGTVVLRPGMDLKAELKGGRLAVANPDAVPAGKYAKEALASLGLWSQVESSLAPAENVRATLALVARGETPLGIVYGTDARLEPKVRVVAVFPAGSHKPIVYPAAATKGRASAATLSFLQFLDSEKARGIFREAGFTTGG
ncbi:MAG: molybdate ABC transporter substrate-binding protein [Reyranellaceae bacterium]